MPSTLRPRRHAARTTAGRGRPPLPRAAAALLALAALPLALSPAAPEALAAEYVDSDGKAIRFAEAPRRTVSLVPGATEILCALGAGDSLAAVTLDDYHFPCVAGKPRVGSREAPDWDLAASHRPDLLIVPPEAGPRAPSPGEAAAGRRGGARVLAYAEPQSLAEAEARIEALGELYGRRDEARAAVAESRSYLDTVAAKAAKLPAGARKRAMRLRAAPGGLASGGPGTVDRALAEAAGLVPWPGGAEGAVSPVGGREFAKFDPQFVWACHEDRAAVEAAVSRSPWRGASAFKGGGRVHYYPCALTDRLSASAGYFAIWLSADAYTDEYGDPANLALPQEILGESPVRVKGIPYVRSAKVVDYRLFDFVHRTLLVELDAPYDVATTAEGSTRGVTTVGNSFSPPTVWNINHRGGWAWAEGEIYKLLGLDRERTSLMFTGADMRNLAVKTASYRDITVTALVTAGAESNAVRTSRDTGAWYQPGTINILVLSSRRLSPGGAAGAVVVATEAKTAALWDMDVRSSQTPLANPATGTGTDDVIVPMAGSGEPVDYVGGHSKIGELIARAVYDGVTEALLKQNGKSPRRNVWERLGERGVILESLGPAFSGSGPYPNLAGDLKALLVDPVAKGLMESAFSLSDAQVMGHLEDAGLFDAMALRAASEVAGRPVPAVRSLVEDSSVPPVLKTALDALATGILARNGL